MPTEPIVPRDPTATRADIRVLCLFLGATFYSYCQHVRCFEMHAAVDAAQAILDAAVTS